MEARFSAPVQTGPGSHPVSRTMGTGSFPGVKSGRGVKLTSHPLLVPWSRNSRVIPVLPLLTVRPAHSLSACTMVHFTLLLDCMTPEDGGSFCLRNVGNPSVNETVSHLRRFQLHQHRCDEITLVRLHSKCCFISWTLGSSEVFYGDLLSCLQQPSTRYLVPD